MNYIFRYQPERKSLLDHFTTQSPSKDDPMGDPNNPTDQHPSEYNELPPKTVENEDQIRGWIPIAKALVHGYHPAQKSQHCTDVRIYSINLSTTVDFQFIYPLIHINALHCIISCRIIYCIFNTFSLKEFDVH